MKTIFKRFAADESGATAIEYGLIAAAISIAMISLLPTIKSNLNLKFASVSTALAQ